jgi:excisionase family DNA binding protein
MERNINTIAKRTAMTVNKAVYSTSEAACYLGISRSTIYRMEKRGLLSPEKTSTGQRWFKQGDLDKFLRKRGRSGVPSVTEGLALYEVISKAEPYFQQGSISIYNADFLKDKLY